jgi:hypothetical protein
MLSPAYCGCQGPIDRLPGPGRRDRERQQPTVATRSEVQRLHWHAVIDESPGVRSTGRRPPRFTLVGQRAVPRPHRPPGGQDQKPPDLDLPTGHPTRPALRPGSGLRGERAATAAVSTALLTAA